jgi:hypothetical protein
MAVRRPIILATRNVAIGPAIYQLNDTEIQAMIDNTAEDAYNNYPATSLSVVGSGGNLAGLPMTDTRYTAGGFYSRTDRFATEAETADISIVSVNYSRISQTIATASLPTDTNNLRWPVYLDGSNNIRAMTSTDFYDTFVAPALTRINATPSGSPPAIVNDYIISTSTSLTGYLLVSGTPVFTDTRADVAAYTADGIGETQDQPTTINNYYLHKNTGTAFVDNDTNILPLYINAGNEQLYTHTLATWRATLGPWLQYYKAQSGSTTSYSINGTGSTQGTIMLNTRLSPTGTGYTQRFVNADDYRTQEFPNGTVITANTYELKKTTI